MKNNRNGQAGILTEEQLQEIFDYASPKYKLLFGICYYTSCRISEALQLKRSDFKAGTIIFRASTTKTDKTREVKISSKLQSIIDEVGLPPEGYLFPGKNTGSYMSSQSADLALRKLCDYLGIEGISTHSFRRTSITKMHKSGCALKTIQQHTGHQDMDSLLRYIEIDEAEREAAVEVL